MQTFVPRLLAHHHITSVLQNPGRPTVEPLVHFKNLLLAYKAPPGPALSPSPTDTLDTLTRVTMAHSAVSCAALKRVLTKR